MKTTRQPFRFQLVLAALALLATAHAAEPPGVERGVRLAMKTDQLEPTSTFEIQFDEPVATPEAVGQEAASTPIELHPAVTGTFRWLTERSGVFTPAEALPLGVTFRITLARGLVNASGQPVSAELARRHAQAECERPPATQADRSLWVKRAQVTAAPAASAAQRGWTAC